jgi:hypothetical protein
MHCGLFVSTTSFVCSIIQAHYITNGLAGPLCIQSWVPSRLRRNFEIHPSALLKHTTLTSVPCRRIVISGGGSLASHLDDFFEVIGLQVLNGWGLTETSPVLACRRSNQVRINVFLYTCLCLCIIMCVFCMCATECFLFAMCTK